MNTYHIEYDPPHRVMYLEAENEMEARIRASELVHGEHDSKANPPAWFANSYEEEVEADDPYTILDISEATRED